MNYTTVKESSLNGRYVTHEDYIPYIKKLPKQFSVELSGYSVEQRPIHTICIGSGVRRIFMWSQMHGNEATTTKAVFDFLNLLGNNDELAKQLLRDCSFMIIPILNPDGAMAYTRNNANDVDLNRDAQNCSQPESIILKEAYRNFNPHFCFNLHDQRTMYNVGQTSKSAIVSFLAPAHDMERSVSPTRQLSMQLIAAMNETLQKLIPGHVGRYDDAFNPNCVGDSFQMQHTPTILFEAGHCPGDYMREKTREYIFRAMVTAVEVIAKDRINDYEKAQYVEIPQNRKQFFDVLIRNVEQLNADYESGISAGIQFKEELKEKNIVFEPILDKVGTLNGCYGHREYDLLNKNDLNNLKKEKLIVKILC